jgi:hypothetical protein
MTTDDATISGDSRAIEPVSWDRSTPFLELALRIAATRQKLMGLDVSTAAESASAEKQKLYVDWDDMFRRSEVGNDPIEQIDIVRHERLGGLIKWYERAA